ncbi:Coiled-coil domain-containing protein 25 [Coemansia sp. RSA 1813]|nr:Coiled-coil domain-containing protein 25 [Coemansia sp. RSA 1646]KAJ1768719.1 Coiled-coil domain-containing protein 25 [Coemansia sp. RSA 1843]KAJ2088833.1 Coiled-coil domain-containing protein 25 [Coemansia sp. RSA 986]KAJ2212338.1 Coiled-coil domain-containing protein 25 [Coemansia sp. RSA 487]KAJ2566685.1 Coiled-coil domain-containing protein 25 [Coemansia sp. RSA 1813]
MVYYFTSNVVDPPATVYMGKDKYENEELIKHGWPEDVWFHADKLSSAHVYLRLSKGSGYDWESIPRALVDDLAQLCKANSIEGNKKNNITIIYTPWDNLLKRGDMAVGQVSFKNYKKVKRVLVEQRENPVVNRLNKTKKEEHPDLMVQRMDRDKEERGMRRKEADAARAKERNIIEQRQKDKEARDYSRVFAEAKASNKNKGGEADNIFAGSDDDDSDGLGAHASDFDDFI